MEKEEKQNLLAKEAIVQALVRLMAKKKYEQITISEITKEAKVSRISYYRNFKSKEEILVTYIDTLFQAFQEYTATLSQENLHAFILAVFQFSHSYRDFAMQLLEANLSDILRERLDYFTQIRMNISKDSIKEKYTAYIVAGALFNTMLEWMKEGMKESDEEMAEIFRHTFCCFQ